METTFPTLDDLMHEVLETLLNRPFNVTASKGTMSEIVGVCLTLENPRSRLSATGTRGKPFSTIGELLWYLSGSNDLEFIQYYIPKYKIFSDDGKTLHGAYGPRLFNMHGKYNQIENIVQLLSKKSSSRQAAIQIFDAKDINRHYKDVPCTCTLQFFVRDEKLHLITYMRSNDAILGMPHDIFAFTMIQEIVARRLNVELGTYKHMVGSLHLYIGGKHIAKKYLEEGFQSTKGAMLPMPLTDPSASLSTLLEIEHALRTEKTIDLTTYDLDHYWLDLAYLLKIFYLYRLKKFDEIRVVKQLLTSRIYDAHIENKLTSALSIKFIK